MPKFIPSLLKNNQLYENETIQKCDTSFLVYSHKFHLKKKKITEQMKNRDKVYFFCFRKRRKCGKLLKNLRFFLLLLLSLFIVLF